MDWALEMLSWPMEWSSLHGIAEIKTPVFKISTSTDPLASKAVVRREGDRYPEEGATGLAFPFRQPDSRAVTDSRSFARATGSDEWKQNGFSSAEGMERAHQIVAAVALSAIEPHTRIPSVIDLGCGNGALLDRISRERSDMQPIGIDTDRARVLAASQRLTHGHFTMGDIFETAHWNNDYSIALLMPGRLEEVDDLKALAFRKHLSARAAKVIVYAYDDWLPLTGLCSRVGLEIIPSSLRYAQGVQAAILSDGRTG
jgi:SAM-dependent methyltransferase